MTTIMTRRRLLKFFGAGGTAAVLGASLGRFGLGPSAADAAALPAVTPLRLPHPLKIYRMRPSFLATGNGAGQGLPATSDPSLSAYTVLDKVVLSPELAYYIIVKLGDRPFPNPADYVGCNNDYTSFIPRHGGSHVDGLLW